MSVTLNPKVAFGKPIIAGTRIAVDFILNLLGSGMEPREIVQEYPQLTKKNILEAITYAQKSLSHEEVLTLR